MSAPLDSRPPYAPGPPYPPPGSVQPSRPWSAGRIVALVIGSLIALLSLGLITVGLVALVFDQTQRDPDGFIATESISLESDGYAIAGSVLQIDTNVPGWLQARSVFGDIRLIVESTDGQPIFVGVAHEEDAAAYLADLDYDEVSRISGGSRFTPFGEPVTVTYLPHPGGAPQTTPADQDFWASWTSGAGEQTLTVELETGRWVAVAMNADASAEVQVVASVAAEVPALPTVAIVLLVVGGVGLLIAAFVIYLAVRERPHPEG
jgi:hypothetical protein